MKPKRSGNYFPIVLCMHLKMLTTLDQLDVDNKCCRHEDIY